MDQDPAAANTPGGSAPPTPPPSEAEDEERIGDEEFDAALGQADAPGSGPPLRDVPLDADEALGAG